MDKRIVYIASVVNNRKLDIDRRDNTNYDAGMTETQFISILRRRIARAGGQTAVARAIGVSNTNVSHVLAGRRAPGPRLLAWMGYECVTVYRRVAPGV